MPSKLIASYLYLFTMFFAQLFMTRAITQNLGIELYGVWAILISIQTYLFAVDSGFSSSVTTYANIFIEKSDKKSVRNLLSTNIRILTLIFSILLVAFILLIQPFNNFLISDSNIIFSDWGPSITIIIINVYILSIIGIFSNYLIATYRIEISKLFQIVHILLYSSFVYFAAFMGSGIRMMLLLIALTSALYLLSIILYIKAKDNEILPRSFLFFDKELYKKISTFIYNTFILAIASRIQFYTDVLVIGSMVGLGAAGLFDINNKIPFYSTYIFTSFVAIYYPIFTKRYHSGGKVGIESLFLSVQNYSIILSIGLIAILIFYGEKFIIFWVGDDMFIGFNVFLLLILSMFLHAIYGPSAVALQAIGKNSKLMKYEVITAIINIGLSLILVIPFGIVGVIYGTIISQILALSFIYVHLLKILQISFTSFFRETLVPILIHILLIYCLFYFSRHFWYSHDDLMIVLFGSISIMFVSFLIFIVLEKLMVFFKLKSFMSISNIFIHQDRSIIGNK
jgi:O-antigen/teichoic acid export membrane protein